MAKFRRSVLFCLVLTITFVAASQKILQRVDRNKASEEVESLKHVKPQEVIGTFGKYMKKFSTEAIGVEYIQKKISKWVAEGSNLDGLMIINKLADTLTRRLVEKIDAVKGISDAAGIALNSKSKRKEAYHRCCDLPDEYQLTYDYRFKTQVSDTLFCQMKTPAHQKEQEADYSDVRTAFDTNKEKVKWQYFGSAEGVTTMFPAKRVSNCGRYDNRLRPWYVTTVTPLPKNIILLLDCSSSMGGNKSLETAKELAKLVIGTLNPQDKVSVVLFNASTTLPGNKSTDECYNSTMANAGTFNIKYLKAFVDSAKPKGGTRYLRAFKKVFEILNNTLKSSPKEVATRPVVILLFTDGAPKTKDIKRTVVKSVKSDMEQFRKQYTGKSLKLLTVALGADDQCRRFTHRLTKASNGIAMSAANKTDPYSQLKPYFDHLMKVTPAHGNTVIFSPPYLDAWGLGFMITAARACFDNNKRLRGVAGVDIPMTDLLSDVLYFNQAGPKSYAFLVQTKTGHVLSHPLLPNPESISEDPNSLNILELEKGVQFKEFFAEVQKEALRNKKSVHQKVLKTRSRAVSRGGSLGDGVQEEQIDYSYSCTPLDVGELIKEFIVCIALEKGDTAALFKSLYIAVEVSASPITYHRMDVLPEAKTCYYTDTVSYADRSVVKFSAKAFNNPSKYLEQEETKSAVHQYVEQLKGTLYRFEKSNIFSKDTVITTQLTSLLDNYWLIRENQEKYLKKIVRRFIGTYNGVLRMLPGAPLPTNFDHISRPWFLRSVANKGLLSFTTPYMDMLGAGHIVSVSHSLETHYANKNVFGVVGADVSVFHLGAVLSKHLGKRCFDSDMMRCFLVDSNGYVVYHPRFENVYNDSSRIANVHITETDAIIAKELIKAGVMVRRKCQNLSVRKLQRFYEIVMVEDVYRGTSEAKRDCSSFVMVKVPKTNVLVVVTESSSCLTAPPKCACHSTCITEEATSCECPCTSHLDYNNCDDTLTGDTRIPPCAQPSPHVQPRPPLPKHPEDLGKCLKKHCGAYTKKADCNEIFGCIWCHRRGDGSLLEYPRCSSDRRCYGGMLGRPNPFLIPYKGDRAKKTETNLLLGLELKKLVFIAGGGAVALLLVIAVGVTFSVCKVKQKPQHESVDFPTALDPFGQYQDDLPGLDEQQQLLDATNAFQLFGPVGAAQMAPVHEPHFHGQAMRNFSPHVQQRLAAPQMQHSTPMVFGMQSAAYGPSKIMNLAPRVDALQDVPQPFNAPQTQSAVDGMHLDSVVDAPGSLQSTTSPSAATENRDEADNDDAQSQRRDSA